MVAAERTPTFAGRHSRRSRTTARSAPPSRSSTPPRFDLQIYLSISIAIYIYLYIYRAASERTWNNLKGGVPREQKMLKGHLPRVIDHQVYEYTKISYQAKGLDPRLLPPSQHPQGLPPNLFFRANREHLKGFKLFNREQLKGFKWFNLKVWTRFWA